MEKVYEFNGHEYTSYYQLEKVMGIARKTIQYRHEVIGIPIEEVPNYKPGPTIGRLGNKRVIFTSSAKKNAEGKMSDDELKQIVEYPKVPDFRFSSTEKEKIEYEEWLREAPEILLKRELFLNKEELQSLLESEKEMYFFASPFHDENKQRAENAIEIIENIAKEREIEFQ